MVSNTYKKYVYEKLKFCFNDIGKSREEPFFEIEYSVLLRAELPWYTGTIKSNLTGRIAYESYLVSRKANLHLEKFFLAFAFIFI